MATKTTPTAVADRQVEASDAPRPDFFMYTGALKAHDDSGERPTVLCTASSTAVDLEADRFTAKALKQMKEGFVGKLIFLNHSYAVPQDVFGLVMSADLTKRNGRLDLDLVIGVEMNNPLAVQTYQYIVNGTVLGISVGVIVTDAEKSDEEDAYGKNIFDISGVIPLEASVVGIPANQTAWTRQAIKSLYQRGALDLDTKDIEARPWLKTVAQIKEAVKTGSKKSKAVYLDTKETRLWVTTDDGEVIVEITDEQKEAIMANINKSDNDDGDDKGADATDEEKDKGADDDAPEPKDAPDDTEKKDEDEAEKKDEDGGDTEKKDESDEAEAEKKDEDGDSEKKDEDEAEKKDEDGDGDGDSEKKDEADVSTDKDADGSGDKKDFDDDVAADEAADMLIGKMFTGLYVALDNLIPILMDTDLSAGERAKQGKVVIEDWNSFIETTWKEITDSLSGDKDVEPNKNFDLSTSLHAYIAKQDEVSCDQHGLEAVTEKVKEIGDAAELTADANTQLQENLERQAKALKLMEEVIDTMMQLPLQTVTTGKDGDGVAQRLAQLHPGMDTRVVERMARFAPSNRSEKE